MTPEYLVGFYGPGTMGENLIKFILSANYSADNIRFYHPRSTRVSYLTQAYKIQAVEPNELEQVNLLFLCVKPSQIKEIINNLNLSSHTLLVSILAGVPLHFFKHDRVCRAMMSVTISPKYPKTYIYGDTDWGPLSKIFELIPLDSDDQIDIAMSIYCCGPAFIGKFYQIYVDLANQLLDTGRSEEWVHDLFQSTFLSLQTKPAPLLIREVACPGGATEQAITIMDNEIKTILKQTLNSAYEKATDIRSAYE